MHNISDLGSSHVSCIESGSSERSEFTLSSIALARARVIGPSGAVGGVGASMGMILGCSASHCFFPLFSLVDYETDDAAGAPANYVADDSYLPEQPCKPPPWSPDIAYSSLYYLH